MRCADFSFQIGGKFPPLPPFTFAASIIAFTHLYLRTGGQYLIKISDEQVSCLSAEKLVYLRALALSAFAFSTAKDSISIECLSV